MADNRLMPQGLLRPSNIDVNKRRVVKNADGSISTIESASANVDGVEWLYPTIRPDGTRMSEADAFEYFKKTGQHLGAFASPQLADSYAKALSAQQGDTYGAGKKPPRNALMEILQAYSNEAANAVSGPVDLLGMGLRGIGVPVPQNSLLSSGWMADRGLTKPVPPGAAQVAGSTLGLLSGPLAASGHAARGLLQAGKNAAAPATMSRGPLGAQRGAVDVKAYGIDHRPMTKEGGAASLDDLTPAFGDDIYGKNALQFFGSGDARERATVKAMAAVRGKPDAMVTVYRGVPAKGQGINPGDWVTLDPRVAADYGEVVSMKVPASHVTSWADSLLEFGYYPPKK